MGGGVRIDLRHIRPITVLVHPIQYRLVCPRMHAGQGVITVRPGPVRRVRFAVEPIPIGVVVTVAIAIRVDAVVPGVRCTRVDCGACVIAIRPMAVWCVRAVKPVPVRIVVTVPRTVGVNPVVRGF